MSLFQINIGVSVVFVTDKETCRTPDTPMLHSTTDN